MADNLGIEVCEPRSRRVSRRLDENRENEHVMVSNEEKFHVRDDLIKSQGSF